MMGRVKFLQDLPHINRGTDPQIMRASTDSIHETRFQGFVMIKLDEHPAEPHSVTQRDSINGGMRQWQYIFTSYRGILQQLMERTRVAVQGQRHPELSCLFVHSSVASGPSKNGCSHRVAGVLQNGIPETARHGTLAPFLLGILNQVVGKTIVDSGAPATPRTDPRKRPDRAAKFGRYTGKRSFEPVVADCSPFLIGQVSGCGIS